MSYTDIRPTVDAVEVVRCKDCKYYNTLKEKIYDGHRKAEGTF